MSLDDFAHNYTKIRIKCPECIMTKKVTRHCKVYHNLSGLWWHFRRDHKSIGNRNFETKEFCNILRNVSKAVNLGMI